MKILYDPNSLPNKGHLWDGSMCLQQYSAYAKFGIHMIVSCVKTLHAPILKQNIKYQYHCIG